METKKDSLERTLSEYLLFPQNSSTDEKANAFKQWRANYTEFCEQNNRALNSDKIKNFLEPYLAEIKSRYSANNERKSVAQYRLVFYKLIDRNKEEPIFKQIELGTLSFSASNEDKIEFKTLGRSKAADVSNIELPSNVSGLHLIFIKINNMLMVFDPFSLCGTELYPDNTTYSSLYSSQMEGHRSYDPFFVKKDKLSLRLASSKLEIIPIAE